MSEVRLSEETSLAASCIRRAVLGEEIDDQDREAAIQLHKDMLAGVFEVCRKTPATHQAQPDYSG